MILDESIFDELEIIPDNTLTFVEDPSLGAQVLAANPNDLVIPAAEAEVSIEEQTPAMPQVGNDLGIANELNALIRDELEAIEGYNKIIPNLEGREDIKKIIADITNEENMHIGQLQAALKLVSPNASSIEQGNVEGEEQLQENLNEFYYDYADDKGNKISRDDANMRHLKGQNYSATELDANKNYNGHYDNYSPEFKDHEFGSMKEELNEAKGYSVVERAQKIADDLVEFLNDLDNIPSSVNYQDYFNEDDIREMLTTSDDLVNFAKWYQMQTNNDEVEELETEVESYEGAVDIHKEPLTGKYKEYADLQIQLEDDGYQSSGSDNRGGYHYDFYRKVSDGNTTWKAVELSPEGESSIIDVTYNQATGDEPINNADRMSKDLGSKLLKKESCMNECDDDISDNFLMRYM